MKRRSEEQDDKGPAEPDTLSADLEWRNVAKFAYTYNSESFADILCNFLNGNFRHACNLIYSLEYIKKELLHCNCYYCHNKILAWIGTEIRKLTDREEKTEIQEGANIN